MTQEERLKELEAAVAGRQALLQQYLKGDFGIALRNRRYVFNLDWGNLGNSASTRPLMQSQTLAIKSGTVFYVKELDVAYTITGTLDEAGAQAASLVVPKHIADSRFPFLWRVRDSTQQGREWQNDWLPSRLLRTGAVNPLRLGRSHVRLEGGTQVTLSVNASWMGVSLTTVPINNPTGHQIKVSLIGVEVAR